ncbi:MAG: DHH family phosphoesterase [Clostridia bacterium]|nr:DHH family phosphoesterase [Clostridia bacterium]
MESKKKTKVWSILYPKDSGDVARDEAVKQVSEQLGVSELCAKLLYNRGYKTPQEAKQFLDNETSSLYDPFLMTDIDKAIDRIRQAIEQHEKIVIYGDYDVDGVTAVSTLYLFLSEKGADIEYYIPRRNGEGYGVSCAAIDRLKAQGAELIVTVDTGITANEEVEYARSKGIDMVITDHHECRPELPNACAVVNPHRPDCQYPFKELAGVGVVFKLICAYESVLCREQGIPEIEGVRKVFREYADLTAIGTIADVMPIVGENRLIVALGLRRIAETGRLGLAALIEAANEKSGGNVRPAANSGAAARPQPKKRKITSSFIGYGLAPKINAAGRISNASKAVELLLADSPEKAAAMAEELCEINRQRQVEENRIAEQAYKKIEQTHDFDNDKVIIIDDDNWNQGIIGIVASRITERYGLPSILISFDGATRGYPSPDDSGKGSGRSVKGMNLVNAMNYCEDLLCKYGGHELAAGLTIERGNIEAFRRKINEYANQYLGENPIVVQVEADCEINMSDITIKQVMELYRLEPFGVANPIPTFVLRDATIVKIIPIGAGKHTKLILSKDGVVLNAVYFGMAPVRLSLLEGDEVDVVFNMDINEFQGVKTVQMIVQDIRTSESWQQKREMAHERYEQIKAGGAFDMEENFIPTREDFVAVYTVIRREFRLGHDAMSSDVMLSLLNRGDRSSINYVKLKFIIRILHELKICGVEITEDDHYKFDVYFSASKTNIEKSSILKMLRSQCRNRS